MGENFPAFAVHFGEVVDVGKDFRQFLHVAKGPVPIALTRSRYDQRTRDYLDRRTAQGMTRREAARCIKRYIAREIYHLIAQLNNAEQALPKA